MSLPYSLAPQIGLDGRLGMIVLQADETLEAELRQILPDADVAALITRIPSGSDVTPESLSAMEAELPRAAGLLPKSVSFDVVGYGCTSAASVIGSARVAELVRAGCTTAHVTDPVSALIAACRALGISKLALLSPYTEAVSESLRATLRKAGIDTPVFGSFDEPVETQVARILPSSIREAAIKLGQDSAAEAVFMSCTNLRTFAIMADVETACAKPALSSNQVLFWHMFGLSGLSGLRPKHPIGRLWDHSISKDS